MGRGAMSRGERSVQLLLLVSPNCAVRCGVGVASKDETLAYLSLTEEGLVAMVDCTTLQADIKGSAPSQRSSEKLVCRGSRFRDLTDSAVHPRRSG